MTLRPLYLLALTPLVALANDAPGGQSALLEDWLAQLAEADSARFAVTLRTADDPHPQRWIISADADGTVVFDLASNPRMRRVWAEDELLVARQLRDGTSLWDDPEGALQLAVAWTELRSGLPSCEVLQLSDPAALGLPLRPQHHWFEVRPPPESGFDVLQVRLSGVDGSLDRLSVPGADGEEVVGITFDETAWEVGLEAGLMDLHDLGFLPPLPQTWRYKDY